MILMKSTDDSSCGSARVVTVRIYDVNGRHYKSVEGLSISEIVEYKLTSSQCYSDIVIMVRLLRYVRRMQHRMWSL